MPIPNPPKKKWLAESQIVEHLPSKPEAKFKPQYCQENKKTILADRTLPRPGKHFTF
jgi:hypothetical protein